MKQGANCVPTLATIYNLQKALRQFLRNEKRLLENPEAHAQYVDFFQEMLDMKHLEEVPEDALNLSAGQCYVLQHHAVMKPDSTTTKCRAVFNGSAITSNGRTLNETLLVGPKQQPDLFETLFRFMFFKVFLTGDVTKMYRQVALNKDVRKFHQMFWRSSPNQASQRYRMT